MLITIRCLLLKSNLSMMSCSDGLQKIMSYKILVVPFLLHVLLAYSDSTLQNCPSQFDITSANVTIATSSSISLSNFLYSGFQSSASITRTQNIVIAGNTQDMAAYIKEMMIPYIITAAIFFGVFLAVIACCLFDRSCPPCQSLRRDSSIKPYTPNQLRFATICTLICALAVVALTITSFSLIPEIKSSLALTQCSLYVGLDSALNGDGSWGGFINLQYQIGNISSLLTSAVTKIGAYFTGDDWLSLSMQSMRTANLNIYNNFKNAQMTTPNPTTTATAANAGQPTPLIDSVFIKTGMGPNGTAGTMVNDIDIGLRTTKILSDQAYAIDLSSRMVVASSATIQANVAASLNTLLMYINQLDGVSAQIDTFTANYLQEMLSKGLAFLQGVYGFVLAAALLILLGVISVFVFDLLTCRKMVHLGWVIFGLAYAGVLAVAFVTLSVGSLGYGFCSYYEVMLNNQTQFSRLNEAYSQNVLSRLDVCLFGDGNALEKFSIAQEMETVTNLFSNIVTFYNYESSGNSKYIDLTISTSKISGWINAMTKYGQGIYIDSVAAQTTDDNPNYAIASLNLYSNTGGGLATGSKDRWVWDATNCTVPSEHTYHADNSTYNGSYLNLSVVYCMSFNQRLVLSNPIWSQADFTYRYIQIQQNYSDAYTQIIRYGKTLLAFRDSRINIFQSISAALNSLLTSNQNFNANLASFKNRVDQFYGSVSTLSNLITNSLNGLLVSSNCGSLSGKLKFTYNMFCGRFMVEASRLAICSLLLLGFMLGGVFAGSAFAVRYAQVQKQQRIHQPEQHAGMSEKSMDFKLGEEEHHTSNSDED